jgi:putative iron-dependent peroxidase
MAVPESQTPILASVPRTARFITLGMAPDSNARAGLERLATIQLPADCVIGIGDPFVKAVSCELLGLRAFPALSGAALTVPSTQGALWAAFGAEDTGVGLHAARALLAALGGGFRLDEDIAAFRYGTGRDLSEYEDGTENPTGERAIEAAVVQGRGAGYDGGSFVAVQRYIHDLTRLECMSDRDRDFVIGRHRGTNEELADAPAGAHVKRSAQESFEPPAFMLRRSMPWGDVLLHGLYFVAYVAELGTYERVLTRMLGRDDGVTDSLFRFTRPVTGGYYFCPPVRDGRLDLRCLGV